MTYTTAIVTAEPRGAYHLAPLADALGDTSDLVHLLPYPEPVQGHPPTDTTSDLDVLADVGRLVVTGGSWSAWTAAVAWRAHHLDLEVRFLGIAHSAPRPPFRAPAVARAAARSLAEAAPIASMHQLPVGQIVITGTPQLDNVPTWTPDGSVLCVSTTDLDRRDPGFGLLAAARTLAERGVKVRVRTHPREDASVWDGFEVVGRDVPATTCAAMSSAVLAYPGSVLPTLAASGPPVVVYTPTAELRALLDSSWAPAAARTTERVTDLIDAALSCAPVAAETLEVLVGPRGGSAARIVAFIRNS